MSKPKMPNFNALETRKPRITKYGYCHWCFEPRHKNSPNTNPEEFGWCSFRCAYDEISSKIVHDDFYDCCPNCGGDKRLVGFARENCHPDCTVWGDGEDDDDFFII
ncbi:MAG: hypothetical protein CL730_00085 [Chloroflexi bacterium]|nr:hypothetical protein [Chloroflexota bacterium]